MAGITGISSPDGRAVAGPNATDFAAGEVEVKYGSPACALIVRPREPILACMSQGQQRRLAAVMFVDMVGLTELMGRDEVGAREARDRQRDVAAAQVARFGGEVRQFYGDGTLAVFRSAVEATRCAVQIQRESRQPPAVDLRIGVHVGDIVEEADGVYGDGVNVAARIESLLEPLFEPLEGHPTLAAFR